MCRAGYGCLAGAPGMPGYTDEQKIDVTKYGIKNSKELLSFLDESLIDIIENKKIEVEDLNHKMSFIYSFETHEDCIINAYKKVPRGGLKNGVETVEFVYRTNGIGVEIENRPEGMSKFDYAYVGADIKISFWDFNEDDLFMEDEEERKKIPTAVFLRIYRKSGSSIYPGSIESAQAFVGAVTNGIKEGLEEYQNREKND